MKNVLVAYAAVLLILAMAALATPADAKTSKGKQQYLQIKLQDATISSARTKPASEVTREPRNWSIKRRSKSSRTASDPDSPLGCAMAASLDPG